MMLTDLADACRKSGLKVVEVDGWRTRGHGQMTAVESIACHHTATPRSASGDYPSLGIVRDGRAGLPGPLAQLGLGRDGTVYVIAAGVAYHAGATFHSWQNNWHAIGIEAEHDGISPWPADLRAAYARLCAALAEHYRVPTSRVLGHKEIATPRGRKIDPNFHMDAFRRAVDVARKPAPEGFTMDKEAREAFAALNAKVDDLAAATRRNQQFLANSRKRELLTNSRLKSLGLTAEQIQAVLDEADGGDSGEA